MRIKCSYCGQIKASALVDDTYYWIKYCSSWGIGLWNGSQFSTEDGAIDLTDLHDIGPQITKPKELK